METSETFIPSGVERAINDLQEKIPPLESMTIKGRPAAKKAITLSCDCELAVVHEDSIHVYLPQYPEAGESDDELTDDDEEEKAGAGGGGEDDDEVVLPDGTTVKVSKEQRKKKNDKRRKKVFFRRPYEDPDAPMIEWKEAHELDNRDKKKTQYGTAHLRFPVTLPDPRINYPLFRVMKMQYPLWHLGEWEGDTQRRMRHGVEQDSDADENGVDSGRDKTIPMLGSLVNRASNRRRRGDKEHTRPANTGFYIGSKGEYNRWKHANNRPRGGTDGN